ncbi:MAG: hypothetical protein SFX73_34310 [Kofleriaceae bacterium]|nr:hypothetical protein [Kofleriaceae bacterium]
MGDTGGGVPPIHERGFAAEVSLADPVALTLRGNADSSTSDALANLVHHLHRCVVEQRARAVLVDITQLEFMNAASLSVLVGWLLLVGELPVEARYVLRFRANSKLLWQERSLHTLASVASQLVERED